MLKWPTPGGRAGDGGQRGIKRINQFIVFGQYPYATAFSGHENGSPAFLHAARTDGPQKCNDPRLWRWVGMRAGVVRDGLMPVCARTRLNCCPVPRPLLSRSDFAFPPNYAVRNNCPRSAEYARGRSKNGGVEIFTREQRRVRRLNVLNSVRSPSVDSPCVKIRMKFDGKKNSTKCL
ncbi:Hypothetical protein CINCED_3A009716 [Cinara cedri]|uniref:Uncharacterized protein n=1 Tax=Cinara cedri TaxID=506608 RepID=A0A5E4M838_9HEMI|nr:Hypothetical protein CINCED_3A009716 [Cinara cedri]